MNPLENDSNEDHDFVRMDDQDHNNDNFDNDMSHVHYQGMEDPHPHPHSSKCNNNTISMPSTRDIEQMILGMEMDYDQKQTQLLCGIESVKKVSDKFYQSPFFFDKYARMVRRHDTDNFSVFDHVVQEGANKRSHSGLSYDVNTVSPEMSVRSFEEIQQYENDVKSITSATHEPYMDFVSKFYPHVYDFAPLQAEDMKEGFVPEWMYKIYSLPNLAIPMSYFCVGVALQVLRTPLIVYFIQDMSASPSDVNVLFTVMAVPWCFKVFYGLLSDCLPIGGQRRKPYLFMGWLVYVISNAILALTPQPSIEICVCFVFLQTAGFMLADVMTDALIVERSQYEPLHIKGTMQSQGYVIRFFGSVIGAIVGASIFNEDLKWFLSINKIFFFNALFPVLFLVPVVPFLMEIETNCQKRSLFNQLYILFDTVQLKAVWQPMTFVYIYNALQWTNASWMNFLVDGLQFKAWMIGIVGVFGSIMAWVGILVYEKYFFASNWRIVFFWCTTLATIISLGQILLVFRVNKKLGISDIYFSLGDDVLVEFIIAVQFLPMCIM